MLVLYFLLTSNVTKERADKMKMGRVFVIEKMHPGYVEDASCSVALNKLEALNHPHKDENKVTFAMVGCEPLHA